MAVGIFWELTQIQILTYILAGAMGAFVKLILDGNGAIVLPRMYFDEVTKENKLQLGFISTLSLGIIAAVIADNSFMTAFLTSLAGGFVIEKGYIIIRKPGEK